MRSKRQMANILNRYEKFDIYARTQRGQEILQPSELTIAELDHGAQLANTYKKARNHYQASKAAQQRIRTENKSAHEEAQNGVRHLRHLILRAFPNRSDLMTYFELQPHFTRNLTETQTQSNEREWETLAQRLINWPELIARIRKLNEEDKTNLTKKGGTEDLIEAIDHNIKTFKTTYRTWQTHQTQTTAAKQTRDQTWAQFETWFVNAATTTRSQIKTKRLPDPQSELKSFALKGRLRDPI